MFSAPSRIGGSANPIPAGFSTGGIRLVPKLGDAREVVARQLEEDVPAVGVAGRLARHPRAGRADHDRRTFRSGTEGSQLAVASGGILPVEVDAAGAQEAVHDLNCF